MKKELIYTIPYETEQDIQRAVKLQQKLYEKFNDVQIYPNGLYEVRIVCTGKINKKTFLNL